jgi:hypothetical protein
MNVPPAICEFLVDERNIIIKDKNHHPQRDFVKEPRAILSVQGWQQKNSRRHHNRLPAPKEKEYTDAKLYFCLFIRLALPHAGSGREGENRQAEVCRERENNQES